MSIHLRLSSCAAVVVAAAGCLPGFAERAPVTAAVSDDFSDATLTNRYRLEGGSWRVVDGALSTTGDRNIPLWSDVVLPENVRIEFTSSSSSPEIDMKVELFGDGVRHESGYVVVLGGWSNTLTAIARLDEHEPKRVTKRTRWDAGTKYRWRIERRDGRRLELFVDDAPVLVYDDPAPLYGPRNNRFAFSGWESEVTFDDLTITPLER